MNALAGNPYESPRAPVVGPVRNVFHAKTWHLKATAVVCWLLAAVGLVRGALLVLAAPAALRGDATAQEAGESELAGALAFAATGIWVAALVQARREPMVRVWRQGLELRQVGYASPAALVSWRWFPVNKRRIPWREFTGVTAEGPATGRVLYFRGADTAPYGFAIPEVAFSARLEDIILAVESAAGAHDALPEWDDDPREQS